MKIILFYHFSSTSSRIIRTMRTSAHKNVAFHFNALADLAKCEEDHNL